MLKENAGAFGLVHKILDVALILLLLLASTTFHGQDWTQPHVLVMGFCAVAFFLFFANIFSLYRSWRVHGLWEEFQPLFLTLACTCLGLLMLGYATKTSSMFSRLAVGTWGLSLPIALLLQRAVLRANLKRLRRRGYNIRTVAIAGTGESAQRLAMEICNNDWMGLKVDAYYDERRSFRERLEGAPDLPIKGLFDEMIRAARNGELDEIYVALPMKGEDIIARLLAELLDTSVPVHIVPDFFTFNMINARSSHVGRIPIVSIYESPLDEAGAMLKRLLDIAASLVILAIVALPMLLIAIGIKLTSRGPVLFKQHRYGLNGTKIEVWKFRTMRVQENGETIRQASRYDDRITPFGAFLRRTSLDELPQFINVLQGRMSIVGPRPHAVAHNEFYRKSIEGYMLRHLVRPGITGWAQVNGWRGETDTEEKMQKRIEYDLEYLKNWSIILDIKIILLTIFKGFVNKNAY